MDITQIHQRITSRFPRMDTEASSQITSDMYAWLRDACSEYPFWFLRVHPGSTFPTNFPVEDVADLLLLPHFETDWLDRGWLHVREGQEKYFLAAPAAIGQYDQDALFWQRCEVQRMYFVKEFSLLGQQREDLEVITDSRTFTRLRYNIPARPHRVIFETGLDATGVKCSWLRFNPVPEQDYLYAVAFALAAPLNYGTPITNRFFQEYQEAAIALGMLFASEYFSELRDIEYYTKKLYGDNSAGFASRKIGLIEKMKRDTRKKSEQEDATLAVYQGARGAVGRSGKVGTLRWRGIYEGRDGFS